MAKLMNNKWSAPYRKMGKHRKKCPYCSKLIQDGQLCIFERFQKEKYYPVKGIMKFNYVSIVHSDCEIKDSLNEDRWEVKT